MNQTNGFKAEPTEHLEIAVLRVGRFGAHEVTDQTLDDLVKNTQLPIPFRNKIDQQVGWVVSLERRGDTVFARVVLWKPSNVSLDVWPAMGGRATQLRHFDYEPEMPADADRPAVVESR